MTDIDDCDKDSVSTLVLFDDKEYVLRASRGRLLFDKYSRAEASLEQAITLTLDNRHERRPDGTSSSEDVAVPVILSTPSTSRFELLADDMTSSPFQCLLSLSSSWTYTVKFRPPDVSESDYAWDNFQDQVMVHTRLSKLAIRLEAWKNAVSVSLSREQESSFLFPVSLPEMKTPPLRLFGAIERNADKKDPSQRHHALSPGFTEMKTTSSLMPEGINSLEILPKPRTPRTESLPSLSRPTSSARQSTPVVVPFAAAVQSQREARKVILKLRSRRTFQSNTKVPFGTSPTSVADTELFPETVALDAKTKAELEKFNNLVIAATNQVSQEAAKAKSELAYYQQLLPMPPPHEFASETPTTVLGLSTAAQKPKKPAAMKRPSKLPSLARPSSGGTTTSETISSVNNQETSLLEQVQLPHRLSARQRITRKPKLQSLSSTADALKNVQKSPKVTKLSTRRNTNNQQHHEQSDALSDFDDPDPEIDDAPVLPDDLSGVATLDIDD